MLNKALHKTKYCYKNPDALLYVLAAFAYIRPIKYLQLDAICKLKLQSSNNLFDFEHFIAPVICM